MALKNLSGSFLYNFSYTVILKKNFFIQEYWHLGDWDKKMVLSSKSALAS